MYEQRASDFDIAIQFGQQLCFALESAGWFFGALSSAYSCALSSLLTLLVVRSVWPATPCTLCAHMSVTLTLTPDPVFLFFQLPHLQSTPLMLTPLDTAQCSSMFLECGAQCAHTTTSVALHRRQFGMCRQVQWNTVFMKPTCSTAATACHQCSVV